MGDIIFLLDSTVLDKVENCKKKKKKKKEGCDFCTFYDIVYFCGIRCI